jgi:hypothetical protein
LYENRLAFAGVCAGCLPYSSEFILAAPPSTPCNLSTDSLLILTAVMQITILAIRPITYFLLEKKLSDERSTLQLSEAVIGLLRVSIESAQKILKIIESLRQRRLLSTHSNLTPFENLLTHTTRYDPPT